VNSNQSPAISWIVIILALVVAFICAVIWCGERFSSVHKIWYVALWCFAGALFLSFMVPV
jgi:apolipoprotein N-acyltransferase